jgi:putative DNA primase/helicase
MTLPLLDGPPLLYEAEVREAVARGEGAYIPPDPADVEPLRALGLNATCPEGGTRNWLVTRHEAAFAGARVNFLLPKGVRLGLIYHGHLARGVSTLGGEGRVVEVEGWREGEPLAAWIARTGDPPRALERLVARTRPGRNGAGELASEPEPPAAPDGAVLLDLATVRPEAVEFLRPQRWPRGKLSLLVGDPGDGKSFLTQDAAARCSAGSAWPEGGRAACGPVILLSAEDAPEDTIVPRLLAMSAELTPGKLQLLTAVRVGGRERLLSLSADLAHLEAAIARVRPVLVVIDPLSAYLGRDTDSHTDAEVRGVLGPVAALAARYAVTVLAVMHLNKGQQKALYRIAGSIAFVAAARSVFAVVPDREREGRKLFAPVKMNLAPKPPALAFSIADEGRGPRVVWEAEPVGHVDLEAALRAPEPDHEEQGAVDLAVGFLRATLAKGDRPAAEVLAEAKAAGVAEPTLRRAKKRAGVRAVRRGTPGGRPGEGEWWWTAALDQDDQDDQGDQGAQGGPGEHLDREGRAGGAGEQDAQPPGPAHVEHLDRLDRLDPASERPPPATCP